MTSNKTLWRWIRSTPHTFSFNEAFSVVVFCDTQEEIETHWEELSAMPVSEQCSWCKDKYDVSWQIIPSITHNDKGRNVKINDAHYVTLHEEEV